jgi:hypothetical protein
MKNEIQIEVEIRKAEEIDNPLSEQKSNQQSSGRRVFLTLQDLADDKCAGSETQKEPEGGLKDIGRPSPLSENGKPHQAENQIKDLAQGSPPAAQDQAGEHDHQGLQSKGDVGDGNFEEGPHGRKGSKKGYQNRVPGALQHSFIIFDLLLFCQII